MVAKMTEPSLAGTVSKYQELASKIVSFFKGLKYPKIIFGLLILAVIYYVFVFSAYSILLQEVFYTQAFDSGIDDQGIWLISHWLNPLVTVRGLNIFGDSITFYHIFIAPFFWLWNNINLLYIIQSIFIALGAIPLFVYARQKLGSNFLSLVVAVSFLLYPALQNLNLDQYHSEAIAVFFIVLTIFFLLKKNFSLFYAFFIFSLIGKDEIAVTGAFIGLFLLLFDKEKRHGLIIFGLSVGWYLLCSRVMMPLFNGVGVFSHQPVTYSHWYRGLMDNLLNPGFYWQNFLHPESLGYYLGLFLPLAFIPLLSPRLMFLLFPAVAVNVLSGTGYLRSIHYHYNYIQAAVIFFALIEGLALIKNSRWLRKIDGTYKVAALGVIVVVFSLGCNNLWSALPLNRHLTMLTQKWEHLKSREIRVKQKALSLVPPGVKVAASYSLVPHLTHRQEIYMFPNPFKSVLWGQWFKEGEGAPPAEGHVDYVVIDFTNHAKEEKMIINYLWASPYFKTVFQDGPLLVLARTNNCLAQEYGANYTLYDLTSQVSLFDDFAKVLKVKKQGRLSMFYFPDSNYYLRNLLGEEILLVDKKFALEISGYLYLPETANYIFRIKSEAQVLLEIDNRFADAASDSLNLREGFHKYKIKYINTGQRYDLKISLLGPDGKEMIIPDKHLLRDYQPAFFAKFEQADRQQRAERESFAKKQTNLVVDGGFEDVLGDKPKKWQLEKWQEEDSLCFYQVTAKTKAEGKFSALIDQRQGLADSRWVQEIAVEPDTEYVLSGWIKTRGVLSKGAGAYIAAENTNLKTEELFGTNDWRYFEAKGKTGYEQEKIKFTCRLGDYGRPNIGQAYFDGISLKRVLPDQGHF
ncbi:hypothetical protein COT42_08960 [Candidatus Saganbacteria bacterium CG08_land_8_20_14_0_20_45_16]|uniref:Uncharacterized protein n=1 Tax=Candidatus Saganbacteria bacterium CG08_land_8_20_14_0_20_45_16 TaxID=2014293 RepID=A0A2H0XTC6_UNCSA|nr:MAG: hypothetical protein COT42_08960 [Candidatus Saganbacteria bacterium CG08_land_8_20_14_0_20_45_16]